MGKRGAWEAQRDRGTKGKKSPIVGGAWRTDKTVAPAAGVFDVEPRDICDQEMAWHPTSHSPARQSVKRLTVELIESFKVIGIDNAEVSKNWHSGYYSADRERGARGGRWRVHEGVFRLRGNTGKEPRETVAWPRGNIDETGETVLPLTTRCRIPPLVTVLLLSTAPPPLRRYCIFRRNRAENEHD